MAALRRFDYVLALASTVLFATACGDGDKRELQETDASVGAASEPHLVDGGLPPETVPPVDRAPEGTTPPSGNLDAGAGPDIDAAGPVMVDPVKDDAGTDGTPHPLAGRYAARTVSYARQKTSVGGQTVDLVSKGVLLSIADISPLGVVNEHLCFLELYSDDGLFSWSAPASVERVTDSVVRLERQGDVFVRPRDEDRTLVSWSPANRPADCPAEGGTHATGCQCVPGDALPTVATDCRVSDVDEDGFAGLKLSVGAERPLDPASAEALLSVQVAGIKAVEWRLPASVEGGAVATLVGTLVGTVEGSVEQSQLSAQGELAAELGAVRNAECPSDTGHVELVKGDFDCAQLMAGRRTNIDSYGVFDVGLDALRPPAESCPDPDCTVDSDGDATPDCMDACAEDASKIEPGACDCGTPDVDANGDGTPDCLDQCPSDPAKTVPGRCGCGVADTDTDGDGTPDCTDECASDANKSAEGSCGCGIAETDGDGDGTPDCVDACPGDAAKTAAGVCGCGTADTDADADGSPDCDDACPSDPGKTEPGICDCGVADADLDGNGTIDCSDTCPDDPAKVAPGACGCGVADADSDGDGTPDCNDRCPEEPTRTAPGDCGCEPCAANPLVGTYAVRTSVYAKSRNGMTAAVASKAVGYSLVTVTGNADGTASLSEQSCWYETVPDPSVDGVQPHSWSKPEWAQALPPTVRRVTSGSGGTWVAASAPERAGWAPARQPASCTATATPVDGWLGAWGSTCACTSPATELPPYDRDAAPYDCRLTDLDGDGYPGVSMYVSTTAPASPSQDASGLFSARVFAVSEGSTRWTITPADNGRHWATVADDTSAVVVGCVDGRLLCSQLSETPPRNRACPAALNKAQFVPVTPSADSCSEIIAQRSSLFVANQDGPWPSEQACSAP